MFLIHSAQSDLMAVRLHCRRETLNCVDTGGLNTMGLNVR